MNPATASKPNPFLRSDADERLRAAEERIEYRARLVTLIREEFIDTSQLIHRNRYAELLDAGNSVEKVVGDAIVGLLEERKLLLAQNAEMEAQLEKAERVVEEARETVSAYVRRGVNVRFDPED